MHISANVQKRAYCAGISVYPCNFLSQCSANVSDFTLNSDVFSLIVGVLHTFGADISEVKSVLMLVFNAFACPRYRKT